MRQVRPRRHRYVSPFSDRRITLGQAPAYMASVSEVAMRLCRIIPRFSLRTLVVFMLLVTSGVGLWWRWSPWPRTAHIHFPDHFMPTEASFDADRVVLVGCIMDFPDFESLGALTWAKYRIRRRKGKRSLTLDDAEGTWTGGLHDPSPPRDAFSPDGVRKATTGFRGTWVVASATDRQLMLLPHSRGMALGDVWGPLVIFSPDGREIVVGELDGTVSIYRRRRPEWWWGVFWLWEFWLTAALAGVFVWSVWRDRGALQRASLSLCQGERDRG